MSRGRSSLIFISQLISPRPLVYFWPARYGETGRCLTTDHGLIFNPNKSLISKACVTHEAAKRTKGARHLTRDGLSFKKAARIVRIQRVRGSGVALILLESVQSAASALIKHFKDEARKRTEAKLITVFKTSQR